MVAEALGTRDCLGEQTRFRVVSVPLRQTLHDFLGIGDCDYRLLFSDSSHTEIAWDRCVVLIDYWSVLLTLSTPEWLQSRVPFCMSNGFFIV